MSSSSIVDSGGNVSNALSTNTVSSSPLNLWDLPGQQGFTSNGVTGTPAKIWGGHADLTDPANLVWPAWNISLGPFLPPLSGRVMMDIIVTVTAVGIGLVGVFLLVKPDLSKAIDAIGKVASSGDIPPIIPV